MIKKYFFLLSTLLVLSFTQQANAQWEQIYKLPATQCIFVAPNGNLIASDFQFDYSGGIYYSEDKGTTWNRADVEDFAYNSIIQAGEYIIASGECSTLARSKDNGKTWELLNYAYFMQEYIGDKGAEADLSYAITYYKDKLFLADFNGGGVIYSEDFGETWVMTDRESLMYESEYGLVIDSFYKLDTSNDNLLLFGAYFVYRLNEENYTWELLRNDSNFMGVTAHIDNKLVCGRSIMNYTDAVPFLEYTTDGGSTWGELPRPEGMIDNNVRAMHSFDNNLIVGLQMGGIYYTDNLGEAWSDISEGIPYYVSPADGSYVYEIPMVITSDDEYIYMAIYDEPWSEGTLSGIYRYKKSNLPVAGINATLNDNFGIYCDNNNLYLNNAADVTIYNINGTLVLSQPNSSEVNISNLQKGIYIYQAQINNAVVSGKFIKQ